MGVETGELEFQGDGFLLLSQAIYKEAIVIQKISHDTMTGDCIIIFLQKQVITEHKHQGGSKQTTLLRNIGLHQSLKAE